MHTLDLDAHRPIRPVALAFALGDRRALIDVGRPLDGPASGEELAAAVAALRAAIEALGTRRAQTESATTRLSRAFVRIAAQNDGDSLLELACRTVGDLLELEAVQCLIGPIESAEPGPLWRRSADVARGRSTSPKARTATLALGGEPGRVGEYVIVPAARRPPVAGRARGDRAPARLVPPGAFEEAELVASHAATAHANLCATRRSSPRR